ncbi:MAG: hypothetical protein Athens101426_527 [Parcubacteria group bacterium Athens1014_26]|nr:MAG: hypothetical protein Athens101426_527 [Parcubacteria group bacterium Athens1014_26]
MLEPNFALYILSQISYLGLFILLIAINFLPLPEELLLLSLGYLTAAGLGNVFLIITIGILSLAISDNILFWLSRKGSKYVEYFEKKIMDEKFAKYKKLIDEHMNKTVFFLRFISTLRLLGPFLAGSKKTAWKKFQIFDLLALMIYVPMLVFLGSLFYSQLAVFIIKIHALRHAFFVLFLIVLGILSKILISDRVYKKGN